MLFILITIVFITMFSFKDYSKEELEKDKEMWRRIVGNEYK